MNYRPSEEQSALADSVRAVCQRCVPPAVLKGLWSTDTGRADALWKSLSELGIPAILVPEQDGGLGGDERDLVVVTEVLGYAGVPDAIIETCLLAPGLLASAAESQVRTRWLARIAEGSRVSVTRPGSDIAPDLHVSDAVIVVDADGAVLYEADQVTSTALRSMDPSSRLFRVAPQAAGVTLTGADLGAMAQRRLLGAAAVLGGIAGRLTDETVEYAKVRRQFGRPIGSFQAVKHQLAQAHSLNELARTALFAASGAFVGQAPDRDDAVSLAFVCAVDAEAESNRVALQIHGGIGFTWEHDLQLWLKLGKTFEFAHGARRDAADLAGTAALDGRIARSV